MIQPSPFISDLIFLLLTAWPILRVLARLGLSRFYAGLLPLSLVIPLAGHLLVALVMVSRSWPKLPPLPQQLRRTRLT